MPFSRAKISRAMPFSRPFRVLGLELRVRDLEFTVQGLEPRA